MKRKPRPPGAAQKRKQTHYDLVSVEAGVDIDLQGYERDFAATRNPLDAIEAFLIAHDAGRPAPAWVTDWLAEHLAEYMRRAGEAYMASRGDVNKLPSLDAVMGLRGRGKLHAFQRRAIELRDNETRRFVAYLLELGCDLDQAAEAMARKMARERCHLETAGCDSVSAASIVDLWNRTPEEARIPWLAAARHNLLNRTFPLAQFLASFPPDSLPDSLKSLV